MDEQTTQSAELTRACIAGIAEGLTDVVTDLTSLLTSFDSRLRAREATEALLLGMLEKLPPAAQETTPYWTQTFACTAQQHLPANQHSFGPVTWCAECGSLRLLPGQWENPRRLLQLPAPQQTEG
jgi:hypothetical protein